MKKLTYAIALSSLLLAGCSQEEGIMENKGELVTLNYNVSLGNNVQSRAGEMSDDGVNKLLCIIFEKDGTTELMREVVDEELDGTFKYTPVLFKNIEYRIVFWAYHEHDNKSCYTISTNGMVTVNENYDKDYFANDLYKSAYTAIDDVYIVDNVQPTTVSLIRPFGQINVYTTATDWSNARALGSTPTSSTLTLQGYSTTFNAFSQEWKDEANNLTLTSTANSTNYCLASEYVFAKGNNSCVIEVKDQTGKSIYNYTVSNLPIGKNQRTNIKPAENSVGLLTGSVSYTVEINDGFDTTNENNKGIN